jgi:hypothetical protein
MHHHNKLLERIVIHLPKLQDLNKHPFGSEDLVYRFYHQSSKVYQVQDAIKQALEIFQSIAGDDYKLNDWYLSIVEEGTGHQFDWSHNKQWLKKTRPQVEAFFHTKYFIDMLCKYGNDLNGKKAPNTLPSGWASILYLFGVR